MTFILPLTFWFLIAAVIHAEPLPGNGHFWLTKPYSRKSLFCAKALFILTFVNVPLLTADVVIIHSAGFSVSAKIGGLLWTQVLLAVVYELPAAAVSAITSGLLELLIVTLFLIVVGLGWAVVAPRTPWGFNWAEIEWLRDYCLYVGVAALAAIVLFFQYAYRATSAMRILAGLAPLLLLASSALLSWNSAFALQMGFEKQRIDLTSVRLRADLGRRWLGRVYSGGQNDIVAEIPIQIEGLPAGTDLKPSGVTMKLLASDGETWTVEEPPPSSFDLYSGNVSLRPTMTKVFYESTKQQRLKIRGTLYAAVYGTERSAPVPLTNRPVHIYGVGLCTANTRFLLCNSAFRVQRSRVDLRVMQESPNGPVQMIERLSSVVSYSPFPADFNIDPIFHLVSARLTPIYDAIIEDAEPIAYVSKEFEIDNVILKDYKFEN